MKKTVLLCFVLLLATISYALFPAEKIADGVTFDKLEVLKAERRLLAYSNGRVVKTYTIALGRSPEGPKHFEGDNKTPEGTYTISAKNPYSGYHKNLGVSYPNAQDRSAAKKTGKSPGGDIKLHGLRNGTGAIGRLHRILDWTHGCLALTNAEIDELYAHTPIGTPIEIRP